MSSCLPRIVTIEPLGITETRILALPNQFRTDNMSENQDQTLKQSFQKNGLILLYHSVEQPPFGNPAETIHNLSPEVFQRHLSDLSPYVQFISLSEFASLENKSAYACVTFDDGYNNFFTNALPVLQHHNIPATLFLNGAVLGGKFNWRDKIRHIINTKSEREFRNHYQLAYDRGRLYRYSKSPLNNSKSLDLALDAFLGETGLTVYRKDPYIRYQTANFDHPLVEIGNHTMNHYVLSSLSEAEQFDEIESGRNTLEQLTKIRINSIFSAPFGGTEDINSDTWESIKEPGYDSIAMSRQRLQPAIAEFQSVQVLERFMPRTNDIIQEICAL